MDCSGSPCSVDASGNFKSCDNTNPACNKAVAYNATATVGKPSGDEIIKDHPDECEADMSLHAGNVPTPELSPPSEPTSEDITVNSSPPNNGPPKPKTISPLSQRRKNGVNKQNSSSSSLAQTPPKAEKDSDINSNDTDDSDKSMTMTTPTSLSQRRKRGRKSNEPEKEEESKSDDAIPLSDDTPNTPSVPFSQRRRRVKSKTEPDANDGINEEASPITSNSDSDPNSPQYSSNSPSSPIRPSYSPISDQSPVAIKTEKEEEDSANYSPASDTAKEMIPDDGSVKFETNDHVAGAAATTKRRKRARGETDPFPLFEHRLRSGGRKPSASSAQSPTPIESPASPVYTTPSPDPTGAKAKLGKRKLLPPSDPPRTSARLKASPVQSPASPEHPVNPPPRPTGAKRGPKPKNKNLIPPPALTPTATAPPQSPTSASSANELSSPPSYPHLPHPPKLTSFAYPTRTPETPDTTVAPQFYYSPFSSPPSPPKTSAPSTSPGTISAANGASTPPASRKVPSCTRCSARAAWKHDKKGKRWFCKICKLPFTPGVSSTQKPKSM